MESRPNCGFCREILRRESVSIRPSILLKFNPNMNCLVTSRSVIDFTSLQRPNSVESP